MLTPHAHHTRPATGRSARRGGRPVEPLEDRRLFAIAGVNNGTWTSIGPTALSGTTLPGSQLAAGRISSVATDPSNGNVFYVGTYGGGVWKTVNAGASYTAVTDGQPALNIGAIAIAPSDPNVIYAGTGNGDIELDSYYGQGVLRSVNAGATWQLLGSNQFARQSIEKVTVDPTDPRTVYVAVNDGQVNGVTATAGTAGTGGTATRPAGIYKSTDGGQTWTNTTAGISTDDLFYDVQLNPANHLDVYATFASFTNGQSGIYRSTDGGVSYNPVGAFPVPPTSIIGGNITGDGTSSLSQTTNSLYGRISLAFAPNDPSTIYATVGSVLNTSSNNGNATFANNNVLPGIILKTLDGGATWTIVFGAPLYSTFSDYSNAIIVSQSDPSAFYVGGTGTQAVAGGPYADEVLRGAFTGNDPTGFFTDISNGSGGGVGNNVHQFAFDADGRLLAVTDQGVFRNANPTSTTVAWTNLNANISAVQTRSVALEPANGDALLAATGASGGVVSHSGTSASTTWATLNTTADFRQVLVDPTNTAIVYAVSNAGDVQKSINGGTTFTLSLAGATLTAAQYPVLTMDPDAHNRLLVGNGASLFETVNAGATWTPIASFTDPILTAQQGQPVPADITAVAIGNHGVSAGPTTTLNRHIYVGTTGGYTYESVTNSVPQPLPGGFTAASTEGSFVQVDVPTTVGVELLDGFSGGTGGTTIAQAGTPTPQFLTAPNIARLVADPVDSATAFAVVDGFSNPNDLGNGTGTGGHIFMTTDAGGSGSHTSTDAGDNAVIASGDWTDVTGNLPNIPVHDLLDVPGGVNGFTRTLYAATDRGVYVSRNDGGIWTQLGYGLPDSPVQSLAVDPATGILAAATVGRGVWELSTANPGATVAARVFDDVNATGLSDPSEPGVAGAVVQLRTAGADGVIGTADDATVATRTTDADGYYAFTDLAAGTYYVHFAAPGTYYLSPTYTGPVTPAQPVDQTAGLIGYTPTPTQGSTADPASGNTGPVTVADAGTVSPTVDNQVTEGVYQKTLIVTSNPQVVRPTAANTTVSFTVTISPSNAAATVTVPYVTRNGTAVAGTDYVFQAGTLTFAPGVTRQTVTVTVLPSTLAQVNKTFALDLTAPAGFVSPTTTTTAIIVNGVFPVVSINAAAAVTRNGLADEPVTIGLTLDQPAPFDTSVVVTTAAGSAGATTDFNAASYTVDIPAGQTRATATFVALPGTNAQANKAFTVSLSSPLGLTVNPAAATGTITVVSNVPPAVSVAGASVTQAVTGNSAVTFTVTLDAPALAGTSVGYATVNGTAVAGTDYTFTSGTITFAAGQVSQTVTVPVLRRFVAAQSSTFTLALSAPTGGLQLSPTAATATGTIVDPGVSTVPFAARKPLVYVDNLGHRVTVTVAGPGSGQLAYLGATPATSNANALILTGTTAATTVSVRVSGGGQTSFSDVEVDGGLRTFSGPQVNLVGTFTATGSVSAVTLNYMSASTLTIGGTTGTVALTFNRVVDSSITSAITIRSLTATAYVNSDGVPDYITAPAVQRKRVRGTLGATIRT